MQDAPWLVVMTKPRMEEDAQAQLANQNFDAYLPLWTHLKRVGTGWQKVESAMFPRYLFVRPSYPEQALTSIRSTRGVSQMVRFGNHPAWASHELIEDVRRLEAAGKAGANAETPFKKGAKVLVTDGPFKGVLAEVMRSNQERVVLLFKVLGKQQKITLETRAVTHS